MPIAHPLYLHDGFVSLESGMDSGRNPSLLPRNKYPYGENLTVRGGYPMTRPGFRQIKLLAGSAATAFGTAKFQGAVFYDAGNGALIAQAGGYLYRFNITGNSATMLDISVASDPNPAIRSRAFFCQLEQYMAVQDGQNKTIIYDGATSRRAAADEVPIGSGPMAYGMGRFWVANGRDYVAGDIVGGPTGVLKFTENTYLAGGGAFTVPLQAGDITAMQFTAQPDSALGQGELLIFTPDAVFSSSVPVDRTAWQNLTYPVQRILIINNGGLSQRSVVLVNGDIFMRSRDGIRSVISAVRNFGSPGNVPVSREMSRVLRHDTPWLLDYSSAVLFDNRLLMTCLPEPLPNSCVHGGIIALDFDLISGMTNTLPPAYDGLWTGIKPLQLVKGRFGGDERCFAFCKSTVDGFVSSITFTSGLFTSTPVITVSGNATATPVLKHAITGPVLFNIGSGYTVGDVLTAVGGTFIRPVRILVTSINGGGSITGYSFLDLGEYTVILTGGLASYVLSGGSGGNTAALSNSWNMARVVITDAGSSYTEPPTVSATGYFGDAPVAIARLDWRNELWEITRENKFDERLTSNIPPGGNDTRYLLEERILSTLELGAYNFSNGRRVAGSAAELAGGDLWVDRLTGTVDFTVEFRPDQHPCWTDWTNWNQCGAYKDCGPNAPEVCDPTTYREQYRPRMSLPEPPNDCNTGRGTIMRWGYEFQVRLQWEGFCRIKALRLHAKEVTEQISGDCPTDQCPTDQTDPEELTCTCPE